MNFLGDIEEGMIRQLINPAESLREKIFIDDLYIAGDLFDYWFCNRDKINPEFILIINKLIELQKAGVRIHLGEGNHDFFLGEYFHDVLGMEVFPEWSDVKMDNLRVLIGHGDTADSTNIKYLLFRRILRSRLFHTFQCFIPASIRWALANFSSTASKEMTIEHGDLLAKRMLSFALKKFQADYDVVIVGHCHIPILRRYDVSGKKKTFIALGDWINHYSFVYYENKNFHLGYYRSR
jgi:UDP-2,3-diacylglucosamine hydrolase